MFEIGVEIKTLYFFLIQTVFTKILQTLKTTVGVKLDIEKYIVKTKQNVIRCILLS